MQCFFCKLVQMSNFDRLNSTNEHIMDRLFPNMWQFPKIHLMYMVGIIKKLHSLINNCSPMQCFFGKLEQMANFDRLNSANEYILDRLFPNLRQIPKILPSSMVGTI